MRHRTIKKESIYVKILIKYLLYGKHSSQYCRYNDEQKQTWSLLSVYWLRDINKNKLHRGFEVWIKVAK